MPNFATETIKTTVYESDNNREFRISGYDGTDTEIAGYIRELKEEKQRQDAATKDCLLNTAQAAELLNVSTRTLQRMRDDHRIEYVIVRGTCRYRLSEVQRLLETNTVRNKEKTIDALFHNYSLRTGGRKTGKGRRK